MQAPRAAGRRQHPGSHRSSPASGLFGSAATKAVAAVALAAGAALPLAASAGECRSVHGSYEETQVTGPACTSPVGLCSVAQITGQVKGQARFVASAIVPTTDTAATGVVFVMGDSVIDIRIGNRRGTLKVKNASAYRTIGDGDLTDTQVIVGGTGDFAGATGALRASGTFVGGAGDFEFTGSICTP